MANKTSTNKNKKKKSPAGRKNSKAAQQEMEALKRRREVVRGVSIVIFALSVLLFCIAVVPGDGMWNWLHNAYMGLFGFGAYLLPFLSTGVSIVCNMETKKFSLTVKSIETAVLIVFICSFIHIIKNVQGADYWNTAVNAYNTAAETLNGGFFGAIIGGLFLSFGKTGAVITNLVIIFVTFMFLSGVTLIQFFKTLWAPVRKTGEQLAPVIDSKLEERRAQKFNIDLPLDNKDVAQRKNKNKKSSQLKGFADPDQTVKRNGHGDEAKAGTAKKAVACDEDEVDTSDILRLFKPDVYDGAADSDENLTGDSKPLDDIIKKAATESETAKSAEVKKAKAAAPIAVKVPDYEEEIPVHTYKFPPIDLLHKTKNANREDVSDELKLNAEKLVDTLRSFGVETKITDISRGPTVTRYELKPSAGVKISKITNLADDIALNLAASGVRIEAPIPNKAAVGIEVPNKVSNAVSMREIIDTPEFAEAKSKLTAGLGKDIAGNCIYCDVSKMPHLLIAGATGAGKSVCMNSIIVSILYKAKPDEVKFLMIDPKKVEFSMYSGIPHLLVPVVTDPRKAAGALGWAVSEMLQRYKMFVDSGVKDIAGYNKMAQSIDDMKSMPQVVIFIDELSDLMMAAPNEVEDSICRLAQMARAAGMHLVIATQRPSVDVITGVIKANIPSRIALTVSSQIDSRTILDTGGAEKLLGRGDMLYSPVGLGKPTRVQGCFVTEEEIEDLIEFIKSQGESEYDDAVSKSIDEKAVQEKKKGGNAFDDSEQDDSDPLLSNAVDVVLELGSASTSVIQRKLKVGYARGARIVDQLEEKGIVGPPEGSKPRKVLITRQQWIEMCADTAKSETTEQISFEQTNQEVEED